MKLARIGEPGAERPVLIDEDGGFRELRDHIPDIAGPVLDPNRLKALASLDWRTLPLADRGERIGPCVGGVGKFICIGLNYADHAAETGATVPPEPVVFLKATSAIVGPDDPIVRPIDSTKLDWEVELGVVIGRKASCVAEARALEHVAGYCVIHDVSERAFQLERHGTWDKGKGCDSFGPIGPWLVTPEEAGDPGDLRLWLEVNGYRFQDGSTRTMVYTPAFLIAYLSRIMTLHPGDVISTGTPPGVGMGQRPPRYLVAGDVVELGIEGLGRQRQTVVDHPLSTPL